MAKLDCADCGRNSHISRIIGDDHRHRRHLSFTFYVFVFFPHFILRSSRAEIIYTNIIREDEQKKKKNNKITTSLSFGYLHVRGPVCVYHTNPLPLDCRRFFDSLYLCTSNLSIHLKSMY